MIYNNKRNNAIIISRNEIWMLPQATPIFCRGQTPWKNLLHYRRYSLDYLLNFTSGRKKIKSCILKRFVPLLSRFSTCSRKTHNREKLSEKKKRNENRPKKEKELGRAKDTHTHARTRAHTHTHTHTHTRIYNMDWKQFSQARAEVIQGWSGESLWHLINDNCYCEVISDLSDYVCISSIV